MRQTTRIALLKSLIMPGAVLFFSLSANLLYAKDNHPPKIKSVTPVDHSTFLAGSKIDIQIDAIDSDKDIVEYRFSIAGKVAQGWSNSNHYSWQTYESDTGMSEVICEVRDESGLTVPANLTYYIINPTVEEVLQKVADNYAKVHDIKTDMVLSSTLDDKPFGKTSYCRYYFMAPDREKTETYSDSSRSIKTDVIINSGHIMYLIDPVQKIEQEVNLLNDSGISEAQFNQADIYHNKELFLSQHTVNRNVQETDFNNMLIALDVLPKAPNNVYHKLGIIVDFDKGIIAKLSVYRRNEAEELELVQETATLQAKRIAHDIWLPVKMSKTPKLSAANFVSTLTYENLEVNSGLADFDFDPDKQY